MDVPVAGRMDIPVAARMQSGSSLSIFIDGSVVETDMANPRYRKITKILIKLLKAMDLTG